VSESRFVEANGLRLHYLEHAGEGPPLVLTHGLSANAHFFDGLVAAGLAPELRVLSFDLRGRGLSDKPDRGYTMEDHAADLLGALDALGLGRVLLGGHSFGALLTIFVAAKAPERVERAFVLDAPPEADPAVIDQIAPSLARLDATFRSPESYLEFVRAMPYFDDGHWNEELAAFFAADVEELPDGSFRSRCRPEQIRRALEATLVEDWPALTERIACPALVLRTTGPYGSPGSPPLVDAAGARRMAARLRDGRLVEVPGNHITFAFGGCAARAAREIVDFALDRVTA
jgi:pimeloyl-ACP methyl ester carboxylesterase